MPGPVSDSYDPEFGTSAAADEVAEAVRAARDAISAVIGDSELRNIVNVVRAWQREDQRALTLTLSPNGFRVIRFALNRALESL